MDTLSQTRRVLLRIMSLARQRNHAGQSLNQLLLMIEQLSEEQARIIETFQAMLKADTNDNQQD